MATTPKPPEPLDDGHRNVICLVGELAAPPQARTLPSGDAVLAFRLTVRTEAPAPRSGRRPAPVRRSDSVECAAWRPALQNRLNRCAVGDVLEISGALRHRYWRGAGGLASRYEVEAGTIRTVKRAVVVAPSAPGSTSQSAKPP